MPTRHPWSERQIALVTGFEELGSDRGDQTLSEFAGKGVHKSTQLISNRVYLKATKHAFDRAVVVVAMLLLQSNS